MGELTKNQKPTVHMVAVPAMAGAVFGGLVWALSPALTGCEEPWDAAWPYYWIAMCVGGFVSRLASHQRFWIPIIGIYVGQVAFGVVAMGSSGPIIMPLFISVAIFGVPLTILGAAMAWGAVACVGKVKPRSTS